MSDIVLVVNAGSSSIKVSAMAAEGSRRELKPLLKGQIESLQSAPRMLLRDSAGHAVVDRQWPEGESLTHEEAIGHLGDLLREWQGEHLLAAVGHRVVHGGLEYAEPVLIDAEIIRRLEALVPLAPLHQPHNLAPIRAVLARRPELPQVACFDTAFHRCQPEIAQAFALPESIVSRGVRRYGFHGLSYEYIASRLAELDPDAARGRTIALHLGNGASACAMRAGQSVASTMGFTAVDGLPMGTRTGNLDPGVVLYLMDELKMDARAIERLIYRESGLLGVSGLSSDMRTLLASDDPRAERAVELFVYRIGRELGSLAAALGGLDTIVFTGGIGEHAAPIRERVCRAAAWLGATLDPAANDTATTAPRIVSAPGGSVKVWVIPTDEELTIARHTLRILDTRV